MIVWGFYDDTLVFYIPPSPDGTLIQQPEAVRCDLTRVKVKINKHQHLPTVSSPRHAAVHSAAS